MFDEEYGGVGASALLTLVAIEELSKVCATSGLILAVQELGALGIKLAGSDEQKRRFLPKLASGEWLAAYALTEAGLRLGRRRDAAPRPAATATSTSSNGSKRFITNAGVAQVYICFAKTDPAAGHAGISAFVVEADTPGFEVGRIEPKMGIKGSTTGELFFDDCRVPAANRLGEEGDGLPARDADPRPLAARGSPRRASASPRARPTTPSSTRRRRETMGEPIAKHQLVAGDARRHGDEVRGGARPPLPLRPG